MNPIDLRRRTTGALLGLTLATALALAGCGGSTGTAGSGSAGSGSGATTAASPTSSAPAGLTVSDAWVKAVDGGEMTAVFGTLKNAGSSPVTVVSGTSATGMVELHEVFMDADGTAMMRVRPGGFEIAGGDELTLQPGGDHVMLMGLKAPIKVGDQVMVELATADGTKLEVMATARNFTAEEEAYEQKVMGGATHTHGSGSPSGTPTPSGSDDMGGMTP